MILARYHRAAAVAWLLLAGPACADDVSVAREWVTALPEAGIYTDGYRPHDPPSPMSAAGQERMIPVTLLDYYRRAWQTFLAQDDLGTAARDERHYKIGHSIEGDDLVVIIQGLLLPRIVNGEPQGIIRVSVGPSLMVRYDLASGRLEGAARLR